jgi:hypothetical protein
MSGVIDGSVNSTPRLSAIVEASKMIGSPNSVGMNTGTGTIPFSGIVMMGVGDFNGEWDVCTQ